MEKLSLNEVAEQFEMINTETHLFYNIETGEFDYYGDFMDYDEEDIERFEEDCWIACPSQWDIDGYRIMLDFISTVIDPRKNELLSVAIEGKGAFRRFKDTLYRVDLVDEWYDFEHDAYKKIAKEWCERNGLSYMEK